MGFVNPGGDFPNRPLDRRNLAEDIAAITILLKHILDSFHLADDP